MNKGTWFWKQLFRRALIIITIVLQAVLLFDIILDLSSYSPVIHAVHFAFSLAVAVHIASRREKGGFKISWIVMVLVFPLIGGVLYILFNFQTSTRIFQKDVRRAEERAKYLFTLPDEQSIQARVTFPEYTANIRYLKDFSGFPVYDRTETAFYKGD